MIRKIPFYPFSFWPIYWLFFSCVFLSISAFLIMELGLSFKPCSLCLWQRIPYYIAAILLTCYGLPSYLILKIRNSVSLRAYIFSGLALLFFAGFLIASYHAGIEWHLWSQSPLCAESTTFIDFLHWQKDIEHASAVRCDEAPFRILGLSPAGWNALLSLGLFSISSYSTWCCRSQKAFLR